MSKQFAFAAGLLMMLAAMAGTGCRSTKNKAPGGTLQDSAGPEKTVKTIKKVHIVKTFEYTWFSAHAKAVYSSNEQDLPLSLSIRMKKDSIIWISVTAILGIEVARVLIKPDSIFVIDKLHRQYIAKDYSFIKERTGTSVKDLNIGMLQALLLGNNTVAERDIDIADTLEGYNILRSNSKGYENTVYINPENTKIVINWVRDILQGQEMKVSYSEFDRESGQLLPHVILINTSTPKEKVQAQITYDKISLEKIENYPFTIPSGYDEIR